MSVISGLSSLTINTSESTTSTPELSPTTIESLASEPNTPPQRFELMDLTIHSPTAPPTVPPNTPVSDIDEDEFSVPFILPPSIVSPFDQGWGHDSESTESTESTESSESAESSESQHSEDSEDSDTSPQFSYNLQEFKVSVESLHQQRNPGIESWVDWKQRLPGLCQKIWPGMQASDVEIVRRPGTPYYRTVDLGIRNSHGEKTWFTLVVNRTRYHWSDNAFPRYDQTIGSRAAAVQFIKRYTNIPVAEVIYLDNSINNPLNSQFMVRVKAPGTPLNILWNHLSLYHKKEIARQMGEFFVQLMESNHCEVIARLSALPTGHVDNTAEIMIEPLGLKDHSSSVSLSSFLPNTSVVEITKQRWKDATQSLRVTLGRSDLEDLDADLIRDGGRYVKISKEYGRLFKTMARKLEAEGAFKDDKICLGFFVPDGNDVMIDIVEGIAVVTSILCDGANCFPQDNTATFLPQSASCVTPNWLWRDPKIVNGDFQTFVWSSTYDDDGCSSEEANEIRAEFFEYVGNELMFKTLDRVSQLTGSFHRILFSSLDVDENFTRIEKLKQDFKKLYPDHSLNTGA